MIIVMVVVVVAVAWIRDRGWRTTSESDVTVRPIDMDVRTRITFSLCRLLCCCRQGAMLIRMIRLVMWRASPRQKRGQIFGSEGTTVRGEEVARALPLR